MNTKRTTAIVCMTGLVVFCFVAGHLGSNNASAQGEDTWSCNVAGTYVHMVPPFGEGNDAVVVTTLVPLDPTGTRLKMVEDWPNSAPGFGDIQTPLYGEAVKVGHDTYKFSTMEYTFKKSPVSRLLLQLNKSKNKIYIRGAFISADHSLFDRLGDKTGEYYTIDLKYLERLQIYLVTGY